MRRKIGKLGIIVPIFAVILTLCLLTGAGGSSLLEEEDPAAQSGGGVVGIMPLGVYPDGPTRIGTSDTYWQFDEDSGTLTISGTGDMEDFPRSWTPANPLHPWDVHSNEIILVIIEEGVTSIGERAFLGMIGLTDVTIPNSVTSIGEQAFQDCQSLESVTFGTDSKLETIGDRAFQISSLRNINIPNSVKTIGGMAFFFCQSLESVTLPENPDFVTISFGAFSWCYSLTNIIIPGTVTLIEYQAFGESGLTSIVIPNSVEDIGTWAFGDCKSLESVTLPNNRGFTNIEEEIFDGCTSLANIVIPDSVTVIERAAFGNSGLTSITIPDSVEEIGDSAFYDCQSLESVILPNNPDFTTIEYGTFDGCTSLTDITIPDTVKSIDSNAFSETGLISISIPDSVTTIGNAAFLSCESLETAVVGLGVEHIDEQAFGECENLVNVVIPGTRTVFSFTGDPFENSDNVLVWVPFVSLARDAVDALGIRTAYLPALDVVKMDEAMDGVLYQYLPYEYVTKTEVPNNYGLEFSIDPALPAGLSLADGSASDTSGLIPGTIYGAATAAAPGVEYTLTAWPRGLTLEIYKGEAIFTFEIKPLSEHPELKDNNSFSTNTSYALVHDPSGDDDNDGHIGVYNAETGRYEITGHIDDVGDQILYIDLALVSRFAGLWIDGIEQRLAPNINTRDGYDYFAEEGSTRVTIFDQTIKELENGEHVAVAAFYTVDPQTDEYTRADWVRFEEGNQLDIVAQKFYVNLEGRENGSGGEEPGGGDNTGGGDTGGDNTGDDNTSGDNTVNNDPGNYDSGNYDYGSVDNGQETGGAASGNTTPGPDGPPPSEEGGNSAETSGGTAPDGTSPGGITPGGTAPDGTAPGGAAPGGTAPGGTAPDGTSPGGTAPGGTVPGGTMPGGTTPEGTTPDGTAPEGTTPGGTAPGGTTPGGTDIGGTTPTGTAFSGLPVGPDGNFYFDLDGSGNPMVLRIDIPFEEFEELRMNGQTWTQGTDYSASSGSTIITIGADRLDRLDAGSHTLAAVFESETVEIVFTLNKAGSAGASPSSPGGAASSAIGGGPADITTPAQNGGALPFIIAGAAVVVLAAAVTLLVRKKRAA